MCKYTKTVITIIILLTVTLGFSQKKKSDTLTTGVIDVVKPYTPSISDAFKVKEVPVLDDETTDRKKEINYNIFSFPVASTFTPAKGKAASVEKKAPEKVYDNYASLGVGSYKTILGEVYLNHAISRNESVGGYVSHHSSSGDIDNVVVDNGFSNSKLKLNYTSRLRDLAWNVHGGVQHQFYNWYGLNEAFFIDEPLIQNLDVGHAFFDIHVGGDVTFEDTYINSGNVLFRRFTDNNGSAENRFKLEGKVDVPVADFEISTNVKFDYLGGNFDQAYTSSEAINYGNFQVGLAPSFQLKEDDLTLNLGISLFYLNDFENGGNKFYLFPNIKASYRLVNEVLIAYGGIQGDLIQNTYHGFANENPFVSPTLQIEPNDQIYNAYVGLKGKISSNMSYNISGHYKADRNKALFKSNMVKNISADADYEYGNSFGIVYDHLETFGFAGEINVDVNRNFKLGLKAEYFAYSLNDEAEPWNLPDIKGSLFVDYQIDEHWFAGANMFYVGERKDEVVLEAALAPEDLNRTVTLDSYFDMNAHVGYHINQQFSVFGKMNNIAGKNYEKWLNFPVQGFQLMAGAMYKFDF
ncbi:TonB-dependent receptor [Tamlana fucoidanivorans]|uniref:TonB-dependent receptor n=1 Tax=Allotamlana fucoidanivorans TaxID=2583814 RepID=A0A5C4SJD4_9FLAO|nr:TonB-dependent receptor [Tamlana fucoidanivorans]TNJ43575.1 TonB-dependent receptor [Tamlana fucoidanivorans]